MRDFFPDVSDLDNDKRTVVKRAARSSLFYTQPQCATCGQVAHCGVHIVDGHVVHGLVAEEVASSDVPLPVVVGTIVRGEGAASADDGGGGSGGAGGVTNKTLAERLMEVEDARRSGLLSEAEYEAARQRVLEAV